MRREDLPDLRVRRRGVARRLVDQDWRLYGPSAAIAPSVGVQSPA